MKYNIQDIMKYLPHRYPFLLIDRVESVSDDLTTAVVIKNSIGAAGILILLVLVVPPLLKIGAVVLSYMAAGILLQPVSDKRITGAIDAVIKSGKLMMQMIVTMTVLFILSIALIAFSTNVNYYAG